MSTTSNDKPAVDFNFDTWERETDIAPFAVVIGGQRLEAIDPLELDFREFNKAQISGSDEDQIKLLFPKDHDKILGQKHIKLGALAAFSEKVQEHYELGPTVD